MFWLHEGLKNCKRKLVWLLSSLSSAGLGLVNDIELGQGKIVLIAYSRHTGL
jgi:hypothetical protein